MSEDAFHASGVPAMVPLMPSRASSSVPLMPPASQTCSSGARRAAGSAKRAKRYSAATQMGRACRPCARATMGAASSSKSGYCAAPAGTPSLVPREPLYHDGERRMELEADLPEEGKDRTLNRLVAITVVTLSVFMAVANIKDDNLVQAMQLSKSDAIDTWSEYQATKTKAHIVDTARTEMALIAGDNPSGAARTALATMDAEARKYAAEAPVLRAKAQADDAQYDALNVHDDQFDMSDALISIAVSLAAVAALAETRWLLFTAWGFGGFGLLMGIAGFAGWAIHPNALANFLS